MATLVSIVLPTYNGARYLEQALQSVLDQTYTEWELIIVDSYSTDDTPHIIARFCDQDSRIRVIQHPKDQGRLPGALNAGFALAQGEYHTWLSDDNYFRPHALETLATYLDTHPEIDLVYSDFTVFYEGNPTPELRRAADPDLLTEKTVVTPSFLYRRAVYERLGGYRVEYFLSEDYDFWLRAYSYFRFQPIHEDLHVYRFHSQGLTATATRSAIDAVIEKTLLDNLEHSPWTRQRQPRSRIYLYLARLAGRQGAASRQRRYWLLAARYAPEIVLRRLGLAGIERFLGKAAKDKASRGYLRVKQFLRRSR